MGLEKKTTLSEPLLSVDLHKPLEKSSLKSANRQYVTQLNRDGMTLYSCSSSMA